MHKNIVQTLANESMTRQFQQEQNANGANRPSREPKIWLSLYGERLKGDQKLTPCSTYGPQQAQLPTI